MKQLQYQKNISNNYIIVHKLYTISIFPVAYTNQKIKNLKTVYKVETKYPSYNQHDKKSNIQCK